MIQWNHSSVKTFIQRYTLTGFTVHTTYLIYIQLYRHYGKLLASRMSRRGSTIPYVRTTYFLKILFIMIILTSSLAAISQISADWKLEEQLKWKDFELQKKSSEIEILQYKLEFAAFTHNHLESRMNDLDFKLEEKTVQINKLQAEFESALKRNHDFDKDLLEETVVVEVFQDYLEQYRLEKQELHEKIATIEKQLKLNVQTMKDSDAAYARLRQQYNQLEKKFVALEFSKLKDEELSRTKDDLISSQQKTISELQKRISNSKKEIAGLEFELKMAKNNLAHLKREVNILNAKLNQSVLEKGKEFVLFVIQALEKHPVAAGMLATGVTTILAYFGFDRKRW